MGQPQRKPNATPKRIRAWRAVRIADRYAAEIALERQLATKKRTTLGAWCLRKRNGLPIHPYPLFDLDRAVGRPFGRHVAGGGKRFRSRLCYDVAGFVALAFAWGSPQVIGSISEWCDLINGSPSEKAVWSAIEELVVAGIIERRQSLRPIRDSESPRRGGGPGGRVWEVNGYRPGVVMLEDFRRQREHRAAGRTNSAQENATDGAEEPRHWLRSDTGNPRSPDQQSTRASGPPHAAEAEEGASFGGGRLYRHRRQLRRESKERNLAFWAKRQDKLDWLASLAPPLRPSGELSKGGGDAAPASASKQAPALHKRPVETRSGGAEGPSTPAADGRPAWAPTPDQVAAVLRLLDDDPDDGL